MGANELASAPALSTSDKHIFETPQTVIEAAASTERLSDQQIYTVYEIQRTVEEIRAGRWKRIALQFPDHLLVDAPRVFQALARGLRLAPQGQAKNERATNERDVIENLTEITRSVSEVSMPDSQPQQGAGREVGEEKLAILADTSYGACCVDEVAAEHADADVVVHYGRSCLSPTSRLPVIYVFTKPELDLDAVVRFFQNAYPDRGQKIILMADLPYQSYLPALLTRLEAEGGYKNLFRSSVVHDTLSPLPNRTVPDDVSVDRETLIGYQLFHISEPSPSLLLTLSSRVAGIEVFSTAKANGTSNTYSTAVSLRRRYAVLTQVSRVPIIGILINTLSVKNYMAILSHIKQIIAAAGKKSYTFVVGKINAAKVANFSEVGGWVVIGCWESSLFDTKEFWRPVITPWELELALRRDDERIWTGKWEGDFQKVLNDAAAQTTGSSGSGTDTANVENSSPGPEEADEEDSEPPEFDLRTGRYISHTRPMGPPPASSSASSANARTKSEALAASGSLIKRANGDIAVAGKSFSPAAEFFKNERSWKGLGSDFEVSSEGQEAGAKMEQGRKGIAKGYTVGHQSERS